MNSNNPMKSLYGNTYPHRLAIKNAGGKWNPRNKTWSVPEGQWRELQALINAGRGVQTVNTFRFSSGHTAYRNAAGRCEDAPCCGCCTI